LRRRDTRIDDAAFFIAAFMCRAYGSSARCAEMLRRRYRLIAEDEPRRPQSQIFQRATPFLISRGPIR